MSAATAKVMVYSSDRTTRSEIRAALGKRLAADLPEIELFDVATQAAAERAVETNDFALLVLDGEATPLGGMGLAHQLKLEVANCPPVLLLVARESDAWLATWSEAEAVSAYPVDPIRLPAQAAELVRERLGE